MTRQGLDGGMAEEQDMAMEQDKPSTEKARRIILREMSD